MQVRVATVHVHPAPESAVTVKPGGGVSVTVTAPIDGEGPTFETVTLYASVPPGNGGARVRLRNGEVARRRRRRVDHDTIGLQGPEAV